MEIITKKIIQRIEKTHGLNWEKISVNFTCDQVKFNKDKNIPASLVSYTKHNLTRFSEHQI